MKLLIILSHLFFVLSSGLANDGVRYPLPTEVGKVIDEALTVKKKAMTRIDFKDHKINFGGLFDSKLDQIAELLEKDNPDLTVDALLQSNDSIESRIAAISLDRKLRPAIYRDFNLYYVREPQTNEERLRYTYDDGTVPMSRDPFSKKTMSLDDAIDIGYEVPSSQIYFAKPLRVEYIDESYRLPFEYIFFSPPNGFPNGDNLKYRIIAIDAIARMGKAHKSSVVFASDWQIFNEVAVGKPREWMDAMHLVWHGCDYFILNPSKESIEILLKSKQLDILINRFSVMIKLTKHEEILGIGVFDDATLDVLNKWKDVLSNLSKVVKLSDRDKLLLSRISEVLNAE